MIAVASQIPRSCVGSVGSACKFSVTAAEFFRIEYFCLLKFQTTVIIKERLR